MITPIHFVTHERERERDRDRQIDKQIDRQRETKRESKCLRERRDGSTCTLEGGGEGGI